MLVALTHFDSGHPVNFIVSMEAYEAEALLEKAERVGAGECFEVLLAAMRAALQCVTDTSPSDHRPAARKARKMGCARNVGP